MSKRIPKMGWIIIIALLCLSLAIVPACTGPSGGGAIPYKNDGVFIQDTIGRVDSLDPCYCYDTASGEQIYYMYEGLLGYDGNHTDQFVGLMATNWTWNGNDTQVTFQIRPGVKFSNGDNMTAEDVAYSIQRAMVEDPDYGPVWMFYFPLLDTYGSRDGDGNIVVNETDIANAVQVVNNGTCVQFNFVRPYPETTWEQILCGSWGSIVDKAYCVANGDWDGNWANWTAYNNPAQEDLVLQSRAMGTGPWALDVWNPPGEIKLKKNDNYWKGAGTVPFTEVITNFMDTWASRKLALLAGDCDIAYCPRTNIHDLDGYADVQAIKDLPDLTIDSFYFNENITANSTYIGSGALDGNGISTGFFSDLNVRLGFTYAFNWTTYINDAMQGEATQRGSPFVEGLPYYNPASKMYSCNLTLAQYYLEHSAWGNLSAIGFKFTLIYNTGNLVRKTACEILANNLFKISPNFQVAVLAKDWSSTMSLIRGRAWAMFQIGWLPDYADPDNFAVPYMASTGTFSGPASYNNATVDALIAEGAISTNTTRRQEIYYELADAWYNDCPGIILAQPLGRRFFTKYVHGFEFNPTTCGQPGNLYYMSKSAS
jgi:peptide/nickel transport system substrate-binding protein